MNRKYEESGVNEITKFEVLRGITGIREYSQMVFDLVEKSGSPEKLQEELSAELPEDAIRTLTQIAESGNYPLSFDGMQ